MPLMWHFIWWQSDFTRTIKGDSAWGSGSKEEPYGRSRYCAKEYIHRHEPMLVEMWLLRVIRVRSAMETRNMLLKTGREEILVTKRQRPWRTCVLWKVVLASRDVGQLAEEIFKKVIEVMAWILQ